MRPLREWSLRGLLVWSQTAALILVFSILVLAVWFILETFRTSILDVRLKDTDKFEIFLNREIDDAEEVMKLFSTSSETERAFLARQQNFPFSDVYHLDQGFRVDKIYKSVQGSHVFEGFSFSGQVLGGYFCAVAEESDAFSSLMIGVEDSVPSVYHARRGIGGGIYLARFDVSSFSNFLVRFSELTGTPIMILSHDGFVMTTSNPELGILSMDLDKWEGSSSSPTTLDVGGQRWMPFVYDSSRIGAKIALLLPLDLFAALQNSLSLFVLGLMAFLILLCFVRHWLLRVYIFQPLSRFFFRMKNLEHGDFQSGYGEHVADFHELATISVCFNSMAVAIKNREQSLRESEEKFQGAFHNANIGVCLVSTDGIFLSANAVMTEIFGYTSEELIGMHVNDLTHMEDYGVWASFSQPSQHENIDRTKVEKRYVRKGGEVIHCSVSSRVVHDDRARPDYLVTAIEDITARKRVEQELKIHRRVGESSPRLIVIADAAGTVVYVNPAFCLSTGYTQEMAVGLSLRTLSPELGDDAMYEKIWSHVTSGATWQGEVSNCKEFGELCWQQVTISPIKDKQGLVTHYLFAKDDITDKKGLERIKEDVERIMRHDLRSPLNAIIGLPQVLLMDDNLTSEQIEVVETIMGSGLRMLRMIDASLDLYKMETGSYDYRPDDVDVVGVINEVIKDLGSKLLSKDITVMLNVQNNADGQACMVKGENDLLHSLLSNLIANAVEASCRGGRVSVAVDTDPLKVVTIRNNGVVPEEIRPCFFQKYKTRGKKTGTGLGTYSAKMLADTMRYVLKMETSDEDDLTSVAIIMETAP